MIPNLHNQRTMTKNCAFSTAMCYVMYVMDVMDVMDVMTNQRHHYWNSYWMTKNQDISNPFERKTLAVENIVEKNKYLTMLLFRQHYAHLHTCPNYDPPNVINKNTILDMTCKTNYRKLSKLCVYESNLWQRTRSTKYRWRKYREPFILENRVHTSST